MAEIFFNRRYDGIRAGITLLSSAHMTNNIIEFLTHWGITALSLWVAGFIFHGISFANKQSLFISALLLGLANAIHNHFTYKAELTRSSLKHLLQQGHMSLVIGLIFVTLCLLAADVIENFSTHAGSTITRESLTIIGWVAMWRPLQIFLYDWWPLQRQIRLYQKLGRAHIQAIQGK